MMYIRRYYTDSDYVIVLSLICLQCTSDGFDFTMVFYYYTVKFIFNKNLYYFYYYGCLFV